MNYFLTGSRGVGKSTALRRGLIGCSAPVIGLMTRFGGMTDGQRALYLLPWEPLPRREVEDTDTAPVCARMDGSGKTVYPQVFDRAGERLLQSAADNPSAVIVLDELGFLEQGAAGFHSAVLELMKRRTVIGVVREGLGAWQDAPFDTLWNVTMDNREETPEKLRAWLREQVK